VATYDLIAGLLADLRAALQWHPQVDDVVAEAADHLVECTIRLESIGHDPATAQALALERYGDPTVVARAFVPAATGGVTMPARTTRFAGTAALWAAAGWLGLAIGVFPYLAVVLWVRDGWGGAWALMVVLAGASTAATLVFLHGLLLRGHRSYTGTAYWSMGLGITALLLLVVVTWAWMFGVVPLALAFALAVRRLHAAHAGTGRADWLVAVGWPVGCAVFLVLENVGFGPVSEFDIYPRANAVGFLVGAALFSAGLVRIGIRLRHEVPGELPVPAAAA
jgi:hypothetical protein